MDPLLALATVAALVAGATAVGLVWRSGQGRIRQTAGADAVAIDGVDLASGITLLQFSSEYCPPCRATARVLDDLAHAHGVSHVELDVAERPELAARFGILQTPTTLVLDRTGRVRARIGGAVRREQLAAELDRLSVAA